MPSAAVSIVDALQEFADASVRFLKIAIFVVVTTDSRHNLPVYPGTSGVVRITDCLRASFAAPAYG